MFLAPPRPLMTLTAKQLTSAPRRKEKLIEMCRAFPEVVADAAGRDHITFKVRKKIFAYYLYDHHGDGIIAFACKSSLSEQRRLIRDDPEQFYSPAYVGPRGWVSIRMDLNEVDWPAIEELARHAYQLTAPKKLAVMIE